jgi:hypothetical protein
MAQLKLRKIDRNGSPIYALDGVRGSLYVSKRMLEGDPPSELNIDYDGFAAPGSRVLSSPKNATPEQIEKIQATAEKAVARAQKAIERAEKAKNRAAKYTPETVNA